MKRLLLKTALTFSNLEARMKLPQQVQCRKGFLSTAIFVMLDAMAFVLCPVIYSATPEPLFTGQTKTVQGLSAGYAVHAVAIKGPFAAVASVQFRAGIYGFVLEFFEAASGDWPHRQTVNSYEEDLFGGSLLAESVSAAISGNTLIHGFTGVPLGSTSEKRGGAGVLTKTSAGWIQSALLTVPNEGKDARLGYAVAIDGDTVIVGAPNHTGAAGGNSGAAYVFVRDNNQWSLRQTLQSDTPGPNQFFGAAVGVEGDTIVVGASGEQIVHSFRRNGVHWSHFERITAPDLLGGEGFGHSLALSDDRLLVGAPLKQELFADSTVAQSLDSVSAMSFGISATPPIIIIPRPLVTTGAAYIFSGISTGADSGQKIGVGSGEGAKFGWAVALAGGVALVGAPGDQSAAGRIGAASVYSLDSQTWTRRQVLRAADAQVDDEFGKYVAVGPTSAWVSAPRHDYGDSQSFERMGAAYLFRAPGLITPSVECTSPFSLKATDVNGAATTVSAHITDGDGDTVTIDWFVDGINVKTIQSVATPVGQPTDYTTTLDHTYPPGLHLVRVLVSDGQHSAECLTTVLIFSNSENGTEINSAPIISCPQPFGVFATSAAGTPANIAASVGDPDGNALTVIWNIDGADVQTTTVPAGPPPTSASVSVTHLLVPGPHTVKIKVSDGFAPQECSTTVTVILDPNGGGNGSGSGGSGPNLDVAVSTRASQTSVDGLAAKLNGFDLSKLDVPVSTRASQAGLDEIKTKIFSLNMSMLDAPVSSRASQSSLDSLAASLNLQGASANEGFDLLTRVGVEQTLLSNGRLSVFLLPEANSGQLEYVRDIVRNAITQHKALGASVGRAEDFFTRGQTELGKKNFQTAFDFFGRSYRQLVRDAGDLNGDHCVDQTDLSLLMTEIRARSTDPAFDVNGDGRVDIADARALALRFTNPDGTPCQ
jgi:hypothetical protein